MATPDCRSRTPITPDAITFDIDMPGIDGRQVLDRLKHHPTRATSRCTRDPRAAAGTQGRRDRLPRETGGEGGARGFVQPDLLVHRPAGEAVARRGRRRRPAAEHGRADRARGRGDHGRRDGGRSPGEAQGDALRLHGPRSWPGHRHRRLPVTGDGEGGSGDVRAADHHLHGEGAESRGRDPTQAFRRDDHRQGREIAGTAAR